MDDPKKGERKANDAKRINSPIGWAVGAVFVLLVLGWLFFYDGRGGGQTTADPARAPNVVTGSK